MSFESPPGTAVPEHVPQKKETLLPPINEAARKIAEQRQERNIVEAEFVEGFDGAVEDGVINVQAGDRAVVALSLEKSLKRHYGKGAGPNQDFAWINPEQKLLICNDGLGRLADGRIADAHMASRLGALQIDASYSAYMEADVEKLLSEEKSRVDLIKDLTDAFEISLARTDDAGPERSTKAQREAEALVTRDPLLAYKAMSLINAFKQSHERVLQEAANGETTACAAIIHTTSDGRRWAVIANIGDSSAFIKRGNGSFEQITVEDSMIRIRLKDGTASPQGLRYMHAYHDLYYPLHHEKQGANDPRMRFQELAAQLTDTLGMSDYVGPSFVVCELFPQDTLLLCTDGTTDKYKNALPVYNLNNNGSYDERPDGKEMAKQFSADGSLTENLDALREDASSRKTFKATDDQALIAITILE